MKSRLLRYFWGEVASEIARAGMYLAGRAEKQQHFRCCLVSLFGQRFIRVSKKQNEKGILLQSVGLYLERRSGQSDWIPVLQKSCLWVLLRKTQRNSRGFLFFRSIMQIVNKWKRPSLIFMTNQDYPELKLLPTLIAVDTSKAESRKLINSFLQPNIGKPHKRFRWKSCQMLAGDSWSGLTIVVVC